MELKLKDKTIYFKDELRKRNETFPFTQAIAKINKNEYWQTERDYMYLCAFLEMFFVKMETEDSTTSNVEELKEAMLDYNLFKPTEYDKVWEVLLWLWLDHTKRIEELTKETMEWDKKKV